MDKKLLLIIGVALIASAAAIVLGSVDASAQSSLQQGVLAARGDGVPSELLGDGGIVTRITNFLLFIVGALAVIMLIFGGIRYTTSGGNSSSITAAKNTILYAIVGLVIAFLAFAVVNFVLSSLAPGTAGGAGFSNV